MGVDRWNSMIDLETVTRAGRMLGRQLAAHREAAGLVQEQLAPLIHYGRSTIANAETGYSACSRTFWERCDETLAADGALVRAYDDFRTLTRQQRAGFRTHEAEPKPTCQDITCIDAAPGSSRIDDTEELRERLLTAAAVDSRAVALLATQVERIREIDRLLGSRATEPIMRGHLETLDQLRSFTVQPGNREALADLYADAASLAGWQCLDRGELRTSWRYHEAAIAAGRECRSPAGLAHAMAQQAYVLLELGELTSAHQLAEQARSVAGGTAAPLLQCWLWSVQGELYAASGDQKSCREAFRTAERLLPDNAYDPQLPYIVLSDVHLARWRGHALARLGDTTAIGDLRRALYGLDPSFTRATAGLHVDLAWALATANLHGEAKAELREAKLLAAQVGSTRQRLRIRRVESVLAAA